MAWYEVIPSVEGRPVFLELHLERIHTNLEALGIAYHCDAAEWAAILERLARANGGGRRGLYLQITRGEQAVRAHVGAAAMRPTVFAMALPERSDAGRGLRVVTLDDTRWHNCDIKATALLANVLYRQEAARQGADEALFGARRPAYRGRGQQCVRGQPWASTDPAIAEYSAGHYAPLAARAIAGAGHRLPGGAAPRGGAGGGG